MILVSNRDDYNRAQIKDEIFTTFLRNFVEITFFRTLRHPFIKFLVNLCTCFKLAYNLLRYFHYFSVKFGENWFPRLNVTKIQTNKEINKLIPRLWFLFLWLFPKISLVFTWFSIYPQICNIKAEIFLKLYVLRSGFKLF